MRRGIDIAILADLAQLLVFSPEEDIMRLVAVAPYAVILATLCLWTSAFVGIRVALELLNAWGHRCAALRRRFGVTPGFVPAHGRRRPDSPEFKQFPHVPQLLER